MLSNLGGPLVSSHTALYPLLPHIGNLPPPRLASSSDAGGPKFTHERGLISSGISSRRRTRPSSESVGPLTLHPRGGGPEGVPSALFKFQPRATSPSKYRQQQSSSGEGGGGGVGGSDGGGSGSAATTIDSDGPLHAGLMEESDLPDVSALLVEVRAAGAFHNKFGPRRLHERPTCSNFPLYTYMRTQSTQSTAIHCVAWCNLNLFTH